MEDALQSRGLQFILLGPIEARSAFTANSDRNAALLRSQGVNNLIQTPMVTGPSRLFRTPSCNLPSRCLLSPDGASRCAHRMKVITPHVVND